MLGFTSAEYFFSIIPLIPGAPPDILAPSIVSPFLGAGIMKIFLFSEKLSIRVGRLGVWIWAPPLAAEPIYLDVRRLAEMGLGLLDTREGGVTASPPEEGPSSPSGGVELKRLSQ